jgi:hypothetical protein
MKVELEHIDNYKDIINELYSSDVDFVEKYNLGEGLTIDDQVSKSIETLSNTPDLSVFSITKDGELIAYFGKQIFHEYQFLTGFFIKKEFRNRSFVEYFFSVLKSYFKDSFYCILHYKNSRAINFILKNGELIESNQELLTFKIY